jgi:ADP-ribose pyrophosphatase YjhB (NUDIX family)
MQTITCPKGCCILKVVPYEVFQGEVFKTRRKRKAGVFIKDSNTNRVLIVQSRGNFWGLPKGTVQYGETDRLCAVREVKEETGLSISMENFSKATKIYNNAIYFYLEMTQCNVSIQKELLDNDANGIGWIKPECLKDSILKGTVKLNKHCKIVFQRFEGINLES